MTARAALDAARPVFAPSRGPAVGDVTTTPEWVPLDPALKTSRERGERMWAATENVLQAATAGSGLTGQALVGEARRRELLTLGDAHALIALYTWVERLRESAPADAPSTAEREVAREAWLALEHAADTADMREAAPRATGASVVPTSVGTEPSAAPNTGAGPSRYAPNRPPEPPPQPAPQARAASAPSGELEVEEPKSSGLMRRRRVGLFAVALLVCVVAAAGMWYARRSQAAGDFREGVAAYERGAREVARMNFARVAQQHPDDARPLVYLGRIAREEGDMARAKRFLESAVRAEPTNALANRELASTMLADGQPELARRFYVRALEQDPNDRLAQGFLGCALFRLGRMEEARRWYDRAGVGDWTSCLLAPSAVPQP